VKPKRKSKWMQPKEYAEFGLKSEKVMEVTKVGDGMRCRRRGGWGCSGEWSGVKRWGVGKEAGPCKFFDEK